MKKGIIINSDSDGILKYIGLSDIPPVSVQDIEDFPREFDGSQVTDYFICVTEQLTTFPSERYTSYYSKYYTKTENGVSVDYKTHRCANGAHIVFDVLGVDHNKIMIDGFRKIGINPWISFRMNDYHDRNTEGKPEFNIPDFYHEHPEYRRSQYPVGFGVGFEDRAFDFAYPEVRSYVLGMIEESLERYDPYGVELDYQREITLFSHGMEYDGVEIINGFMREIDALVHKYEKKYAHEIKMAVRVAADIQTNFDFGLDVMQWVREGIVDMVIPTGRFSSNDNDIPVKLWSNMLKPYGVILAPGIEPNLGAYRGAATRLPNIETFAAFAANAYAQGADKVYIYNYFRSNIHQHFDKNAPFDFDPTKSFMALPTYWTAINTLGDPDAVMRMNRRHIITYKDRKAAWINNGGISQQLPATTSYTCGFKLFVGDIPENAELTLRLGVKDTERAAANPPRVFVNRGECKYIGTELDERFAGGAVLCYSIPKEVHSKQLCPRVSVNEVTEFTYVEIFVKVTD